MVFVTGKFTARKNVKEPGQVITFYSYKGGTGRSMALANIACLLADNGKRVLAIDWDLDAPGLHRFFNVPVENHPGLIELFKQLDDKIPKERSSFNQEHEKDCEEEAESIFNDIELEHFIIHTTTPNLDFLQAGSFDESYSSRVNTFDWEYLYKRSTCIFRIFAQWLTEPYCYDNKSKINVENPKHYDYVLIDSKTGLADISGICTMLMPEKLVVVFTPNLQSLTGTETLVKEATEYRRTSNDLRPLLIYPLPSRIESTRDDLRKSWRFGNLSEGIKGYQPLFERLLKDAYQLPECKLGEYFDKVQIQQSPDYAYGERIAVTTETNALTEDRSPIKDRFTLAHSYEIFLEWLKNSSNPWESRRTDTQEQSLDGLEKELTEAKQSGKDENKLIELLKQIIPVSKGFYGETHLHTLQHLYELGVILANSDQLSEAQSSLEEALEGYKKLVDTRSLKCKPAMAGTYYELGIVFNKREKFNEARKCYKEALALCKELENASPKIYELYEIYKLHVNALNKYGEVLHALKEFNEARHVLEDALKISDGRMQSDPDFEPIVASILNNLVKVLLDQDDLNQNDLDEAQLKLAKVRQLDDNLEQRHHDVQKSIKLDLARNHIKLGEKQYAKENLESARQAFNYAYTLLKPLEKQLDSYKPLATNLAKLLSRVGETLYKQNSHESLISAREDFQNALDIYRSILSEDFDNDDIIYSFAETLTKQGHVLSKLGVQTGDNDIFIDAYRAFKGAGERYEYLKNRNFGNSANLFEEARSNLGKIKIIVDPTQIANSG